MVLILLSRPNGIRLSPLAKEVNCPIELAFARAVCFYRPPPSSQHRRRNVSGSFCRRPFFILPSGQGRSSPRKLRFSPLSSRSKTFHRARYALTTDAIQKVRAPHERPRKGRIYQPTFTSMSYITDFESELTAKLESAEDTASIVKWISEKVLQSYKNGITAGQKGAQVIRKGESRRRSSFGKKAE